MWSDMIYNRCFGQLPLCFTIHTQWVKLQVMFSGFPPPAVIAPAGRGFPIPEMQLRVCRTILPFRQFRASRMAAGLCRFLRHANLSSRFSIHNSQKKKLHGFLHKARYSSLQLKDNTSVFPNQETTAVVFLNRCLTQTANQLRRNCSMCFSRRW